jgi:hypothetical protein
MVLSISAIGAALLLCWAGISGADVGIFHVLYISLIVLLALMCTSTNMRSGLVVTSLLVVLVALWVFSNASYVQPVLYNSDLNTEWRIVQYLVSNGHLPQLNLGTKFSTYAIYPGLELVATSLELVSGVAAYDFLTYGGAVLSGVAVLLALTFYRRLLPQRSLATSAIVVAAFSVSMIAYGALAIHQTLALVFVCLALVGLSLGRKSPLQAAILFGMAGLAIVVSHILTGFLFLLLIAVYTVCTWILKRRLDRNRQMIQSRHLLLRLSASLLLLYTTIYLTWNAMVSTEIVGIGYSTILQVLSSPWREYATVSVTPGGIRPVWITALAFLGFGSYGLVTLAGLFVSIRSRLSKLAALIPIGLSGGAIFLMLYFVPIAGTPSAGIQGRGYLYAYLFGAPLFVVGLRFVSTRKPLVLHSRVFHRRVLPLLIIAVVLSPAVYYGLSPYQYDPTTPLTGLDTRLGLAAEYGACVFASHYSTSPEVLVVDIAARMGGDLQPRPGTTISPIRYFVPSYYDNLTDLVRGHCLTMIMRQSITRVPDRGYTVSTADYEYLLAASNIVYSSGDPSVLYVTYCPSGVPP